MELPGVVAHDEQGDYGPFNSGMGPYGEQQGRMGGGGWVDDPMGLSGKDPLGVHSTPWGADGEKNVAEVAIGMHPGDGILNMVMSWDNSWVESRRETNF